MSGFLVPPSPSMVEQFDRRPEIHRHFLEINVEIKIYKTNLSRPDGV